MAASYLLEAYLHMRHIFYHISLKKWFLITVFIYAFVSFSLYILSTRNISDPALLSSEVSAETGIAYPVDKIEIPKLGVVAPLSFVASTDPADYKQPLKEGVALYPSAKPGTRGSAIILGHSAPLGWPKINYDWVFSNISTLKLGDEILIYYEGKKYTFKTTGSLLLKKGQDIPSFALASQNPTILLVSCWPPGINNKRIVVQAELKEGI